MPTHRHDPQSARQLARSLECDVGVISSAGGAPRPAIFGGAARFASTLKAHGAQWNRSHKAHVFSDWESLLASLNAVQTRLRRTDFGAADLEPGEEKQADPCPRAGLTALFAQARNSSEKSRS